MEKLIKKKKIKFYEIKLSLPFFNQNNNFNVTPCWCVATNLRSHGVFNAHDADAGQSAEDVIFIVPVRFTIGGGEISVCKADGPQALWGHGLNHFLNHVISVPWAEHLGLAICCQDFIAPSGENVAC